MQDISAQVLAAIKFGDLTSIVTVAGLALISLAFLSFALRKGQQAANGRIGEDDDERDRDDD